MTRPWFRPLIPPANGRCPFLWKLFKTLFQRKTFRKRIEEGVVKCLVPFLFQKSLLFGQYLRLPYFSRLSPDDTANFLFWELWEWLTIPMKIMASICGKLSCLRSQTTFCSLLLHVFKIHFLANLKWNRFNFFINWK